MKIAIKATHLVPGGGLMHFNRITEWFGRLAPQTRFIVLARDGQQHLFETVPNNFEYHYFNLPARNLATRILWEKFKLPGIIEELKPDLLFEPGNYGTSGVSCPKVLLLHNIAPFDREFIRGEGLYQKIRLNLLRAATINSMRTSQGVIFLADYVRGMLGDQFDPSRVRTSVIYHGRPQCGGTPDEVRILHELGITGQFLLCVSHIYRYKKIREMVEAYLLALKSNSNLPPLYIAGAPYDKSYARDIQKTIERAGLE
ncbi:MAG: hypothetical protein KAU36_05425, partial [candidate division Zixibacteria bacterium]|nr:hypothetical protein [candidate division Zixibacteria bacterium]